MLPISRRTLSQFISIIACFVFVIWGFSEYGKSGDIPYEQAVGLLLALAAFLGSSRISEKPVFQPSEKEMAARDAFNRQAMLNRVRDFWVKGVLESSLHKEARIGLGLEERRNAVAERPWDVILRTADRPNCVLPPGTKISDVFERVGRFLLILGEPGAGKTTTLLELAREMIDRAEKDPTEKIPVVFNLSSWTDPKQTLNEWMAEEMVDNYRIQKEIAETWIENDALLPLLDGLDEVADERRADCVDVINGYLNEHSAQAVICCRKEEYEALDAKLKLQSAILLQPLTPEQIDGYLERLSPDLNALREALKEDQELREFAKTPLILSIMTLAYLGMPVEEIQSLGSIEDRRRHLFKTYIDKMFERTGRTDPKLYPKEDTIRWLSRLAQKMSEHGQTEFRIFTRMQTSLLETKTQHLLQRLSFILVILTVGLVFVLASGLAFAVGPLEVKPEIVEKIVEISKWSWKEVFSNLVIFLLYAIVASMLLSWTAIVIIVILFVIPMLMLKLEIFFTHYTLRFVFSRNDILPWKLVPFLDYATERIFLRKVGGGYVFVHRMLMEYFASLEPGPGGR
jgi:DNA polymerase III delta prime subunit